MPSYKELVYVLRNNIAPAKFNLIMGKFNSWKAKCHAKHIKFTYKARAYGFKQTEKTQKQNLALQLLSERYKLLRYVRTLVDVVVVGCILYTEES